MGSSAPLQIALLLGCIEIDPHQRLACLRQKRNDKFQNAMKKIKRRPSLTTTIVIIIEIRRNISAPALSAVEIEDGIISMPVLDSDWSVFSLFLGKLTSFYF